MGKKGIPDGWEDYTNMGRQIPGTRIICFKVPLNDGLLSRLPPSTDRFGPRDLMDHCSALGLVVDLTNTGRYYNPQEFFHNGVEYVKLATVGHVIPNNKVVKRFFTIVETFLEENKHNDTLIGVHCTHGLNRTGYLVCRYMVQQLGVPSDQAISAFNSARGHEQERENYLEDIRRASWNTMEPTSPVAASSSSSLLPSYNQRGFQSGNRGRYQNSFNAPRNSLPGGGYGRKNRDFDASAVETPPYMPHRSRNGNGRKGFNGTANDGVRPHHSRGSSYTQSTPTDSSGFNRPYYGKNSYSGNSFHKQNSGSYFADNHYEGKGSANSSMYESPYGRKKFKNSYNKDYGQNQVNNFTPGDGSSFGRKKFGYTPGDETPFGRKRLAKQHAVEHSPYGRKQPAHSTDNNGSFGRNRYADTSIDGSSYGQKRSADSSWEESEPKLKSPRFGKEYYERYFGAQVLPQYDSDFYSRGAGGIGPHRPLPRGVPPVKGDGRRPKQYRGPKQYCSPENPPELNTPYSYKNSRNTPYRSSLLSPDENSTPKSKGTPNLVHVEGPGRNAFSPGARNEVFSPDSENSKRIRSNRFQPY